MVGAGSAVAAAASVAISWRHFKGLKLAEPGTQRIETEVAGCVKRMSAIVSQTTLDAAASRLSCLSVI
jgi:hypothetical protein